MKLATLACLAALCLLGPGALAAPGDPPRPDSSRPDPSRPEQSRSDQPRPEPPRPDKAGQSRADAAAKAEPGRSGPPAGGGARERRRRSYAACNRASHQRGYVGGRRRRFLIRCRLGYERTRGQQGQAPAPSAPPAATPQPGRKP